MAICHLSAYSFTSITKGSGDPESSSLPLSPGPLSLSGVSGLNLTSVMGSGDSALISGEAGDGGGAPIISGLGGSGDILNSWF
ncbi:hypothetical protein M427DRAFT_36638 [Gonapodya prolifera JEL478]|uniref:Uncharacterized protein n=1 Tax=Gonapodya prolifera (strain JEL478) TaxID=1344416 RepID=A0A139A236_GONPJ|nr:hypothetical protein M427DRAFT_36638 [Gonapodya prolifera JEL478]|eukprot:KXS10832.1 hypothetical protein M427DRAFT_36638 [Gonapodya prolifera JEL478]